MVKAGWRVSTPGDFPPPHDRPAPRTPPYHGHMPEKKLTVALGAIIALIFAVILLGQDTPTPEGTTPPQASTPPPRLTPSPQQATPLPAAAQDPTGDQIAAHLASSLGHPTLDDACLRDGITWACDVETLTPRAHGTSLEVRVRTLSGRDGDQTALAFYNFLAADGSPTPNLRYVQITTAQDGQVGSYKPPV